MWEGCWLGSAQADFYNVDDNWLVWDAEPRPDRPSRACSRGPALAALAQQIGDEGRIDSLIRATRRDIGQPVNVEDMARRAGMSLSAFHRGDSRDHVRFCAQGVSLSMRG